MWWSILALADPVADRCVESGSLDAAGHADLVVLRRRSFAEPDAVLVDAERFADRWPDCPAGWMLAAAIERARAREDEALAHLDRAAGVAPDWPEVARAHAAAHARSGDPSHLAQAYALAPDDAELEVLRILSLPVSERADPWRALIQRHPDDSTAVRAALEGLVEAGHPLEARELGLLAVDQNGDGALAEVVAGLRSPYEPPPPPRERRPAEYRVLEDGTTEIVVYSPGRAREALTSRLAEIGYGHAEPIRGGTRYHSDTPVRPYVDILDDGTVHVQESGAVSLAGPPPPGIKLGNTGARLWGPILSVSEVISARKLRPDRVRVMEEIWLEVTEWRQAMTRQTFAGALGEALPDRLQALWDDGEPFYGEERLETPAARRAALLAHWATRACTDEGDAAAAIVARFLLLEVDASETPLLAEEIARAEAEAACGRTLRDAPPR
ncbi:MAG: hypothetical protein H6737_21025 [Alphaproteobacteria bacterium]|nr:hypothetical protein [Alphaproteobacteria bacterium]